MKSSSWKTSFHLSPAGSVSVIRELPVVKTKLVFFWGVEGRKGFTSLRARCWEGGAPNFGWKRGREGGRHAGAGCSGSSPSLFAAAPWGGAGRGPEPRRRPAAPAWSQRAGHGEGRDPGTLPVMSFPPPSQIPSPGAGREV